MSPPPAILYCTALFTATLSPHSEQMKCFDGRKPRERVQRIAMRAARAADLTRRHLQHDSRGEFRRYGADHGAAFVAGNIGLISAHADNKAAAAIRSRRHLMRDYRAVLFIAGHIFTLAAVRSGLPEGPSLDPAGQYAAPLIIAQNCHVQDGIPLRPRSFPVRRTEELKRVGSHVEQAAAHGGIRVLPGVIEADTAAALHVDIFSPRRAGVLASGN
jgi:hypothetical protein